MNITFGKLLKADLRKRLWMIILIFAVSIVAYPIFYQIFLSSVSEGNTDYIGTIVTKDNATELVLGWRNRSIYYIVTGAAILAAVTGFAYLDLEDPEMKYQGRNVDKDTWFKVRWLGGYIAGIVPVLIGALIAIFAIAPINVAFSAPNIGMAFSTLGIVIVGFTAIYAACVLAMVLTGKIITGLLMCGLFLGYAPMCGALIGGFKDGFFSRIYIPYEHMSDSPFMYFSPVTAFRIVAERPSSVWGWISLGVFIAAGTALSFKLVKLRTQDTPGYAMLYDRMRGIVKVIWGIPVALVAGMIFTVFSDNKATFMFILGTYIGAFVVNIAIQYLFDYDIETNKRHFISGGVIFGGVTVVILILFCDPFGINRNIPAKENVKSMSVASSDTSGQLRLLGGFMENEDSINARDTDWLLTNTFIEDFDKIYDVASEGTKYKNANGRAYTEVYVGFELNNGRKLYRKYDIDLTVSQETIDNLSELETYRERFYPTAYIENNAYKQAQLGGWNFADLMDAKDKKRVDLSEEQVKNLTKAIKEDSLKFSSKKLKESMPTGDLILYYEKSGFDEIYVYPEYTNTIKVLESLGMAGALKFNPAELPKNIQSATLKVAETSNALQTSEDTGEESDIDVENLNNVNGMLYGTYRMEAKDYDFGKNEIESLLECLAPARAGVMESMDRSFTLTLKRAENDQDFYEAVVTDEKGLNKLLEGK